MDDVSFMLEVKPFRICLIDTILSVGQTTTAQPVFLSGGAWPIAGNSV